MIGDRVAMAAILAFYALVLGVILSVYGVALWAVIRLVLWVTA